MAATLINQWSTNRRLKLVRAGACGGGSMGASDALVVEGRVEDGGEERGRRVGLVITA
jgi:hypothetical protein